MPLELPFFVSEFKNASGTTSFRVSGSWKGERIRKNFAERALADALCNAKNADALKPDQARRVFNIIQTTASEKDVRLLESLIDRVNDRWPLRDVFKEGVSVMEQRRPAVPLASLVDEWLLLIETEVSDRWYSDLKHRVTTFRDAHPKLTSDKLNRALVREWLDGLPLAQQSKANMRNAVHRFGGWLVERGYVAENPASEIRITRRRSGALQGDRPLPTIFTPRQCEALLYACQLGACRRLLGWMATCLFTGMRPDSEAPRATWAEVNLETAEWSVMGRKRGAKPRIIPLQPAAAAWLKVAEADKIEKPALYYRQAKERAIQLANEWLKEHHPEEKPIEWDNDITRHTFASYRSAQIPVIDLAEEMGNSPGTIYAHYRHPRPAAVVKAFWALRPTK